jgi:hypothetical protein
MSNSMGLILDARNVHIDIHFGSEHSYLPTLAVLVGVVG